MGPPVSRLPEVTVCISASLFVHVTVVPLRDIDNGRFIELGIGDRVGTLRNLYIGCVR